MLPIQSSIPKPSLEREAAYQVFKCLILQIFYRLQYFVVWSFKGARVLKIAKDITTIHGQLKLLLIILIMKFKKFLLKDFPSPSFPEDLSCFELVTADSEELSISEGEAVVKVMWISSDPLLRTWISGARSYLEPVGPGASIPGFGVGKVVKILKKKGKKTQIEPNDWVFGMLQWSQYMKCDYKIIQKVPVDNGEEMYKFLTIYGPSGYTAFQSIRQEILPFTINDPKTGQPKTKDNINILISSIAGGIGLTITEYLTKMGYKNVYGIAGTDQKCNMALKMGCKAALNYKKFYDKETIHAKEFETALRSMMGGESVDIYYENVGEDMLSSALNLMADHSKVIMCGATATYNNWGSKEGVRNFENIVSKRIQLKGILYFDDSANERIKVFLQMASLEMEGCQVLIHGIEHLPQTYRDMIQGKFIGKPLIQLFKDPVAPADQDL